MKGKGETLCGRRKFFDLDIFVGGSQKGLWASFSYFRSLAWALKATAFFFDFSNQKQLFIPPKSCKKP